MNIRLLRIVKKNILNKNYGEFKEWRSLLSENFIDKYKRKSTIWF